MRTGCPGSWLVMSMDFALEHRTSPVMRADRQRNPRCFSTGKSLPHPKECGGKPVKNREKQVFHNCLPVFEVARLFGCFDHVASIIENADHSVMGTAVKLCVADCVAGCVWLTVPQPAKRQRIVLTSRRDFFKTRRR